MGVDNQLRVRLSVALSLRFQLLSLSRNLVCGLIICSALTAMRALPGGGQLGYQLSVCSAQERRWVGHGPICAARFRWYT